MNLIRIGKNVQRARQNKNLKQRELAEKVGVTEYHISRIETGKAAMSLDILIELSNVLETTPDYLLFGEYNITPERTALVIGEKLKNLTQDELDYILDIAEMFKKFNVNRMK
jgi:transcriptional regulator with XRE-family HTH domain